MKRYSTLVSCILVLALLPQLFLGYGDGKLHLLDPVTTNQLGIVMSRLLATPVENNRLPHSTTSANSNKKPYSLLWSSLLSLFPTDPIVRDGGPLTNTQAEIGVYARIHSEKPYFLPIQIGGYRQGNATRSQVQTLSEKYMRKISR